VSFDTRLQNTSFDELLTDFFSADTGPQFANYAEDQTDDAWNLIHLARQKSFHHIIIDELELSIMYQKGDHITVKQKSPAAYEPSSDGPSTSEYSRRTNPNKLFKKI
jgi:hypothetical protein